MLITVTLNPSIDKLYTIRQFVPYEVMRVEQVVNNAGGKGLNVSRVAAIAGEPVTATGFVGGFNGQYLISLLNHPRITPAFTEVAAETRSCINAWDLGNSGSTEYLEPGAPVTEAEIARFLEDFARVLPQGDVVSISGSMPQGTPPDLYETLIGMAKRAGKPVLLDTSGDTLRRAVKAQPALIKPNVDEIEQLTGQRPTDRGAVIAAAQRIREGGVGTVVVSLGAEGALMIAASGVYHGKPPKIDVVNTVSCGDSMLAGFAVAMRRGLSDPEALRLAVAISAANALTMPTGYYLQEDFERLWPLVDIQTIS